MTQELTYEQVIEMEENIRLKNKAEEIYNNFMKNVKLDLSTFKDGRFRIWNDSIGHDCQPCFARKKGQNKNNIHLPRLYAAVHISRLL